MCGIFFSCDRTSPKPPSLQVQQVLASRGPDSCDHLYKTFPTNAVSNPRSNQPIFHLTFLTTVLSLRGDTITKQPLNDPATDSCLCWNGEAWSTCGIKVQGSDSETVFRKLCTALHRCEQHDREQSLVEVIRVLNGIKGPYAFIFFDAIYGRVFYGRDNLGRRSLLLRTGEENCVTLSSLADPETPETWREVEAHCVFVLDLIAQGRPSVTKISPNQVPNSVITQLPLLNREVPILQPKTLDLFSSAVQELEQHLRESLLIRSENIRSPSNFRGKLTPIAILFSGGLDCTLLARMLHEILSPEQDIDLLNVAFENPRSVQAALKSSSSMQGMSSAFDLCPDRRTGLRAVNELRKICPTRTWRFVFIDIPYSELVEHRNNIVHLMRPHNTEMDLSICCALYFASRGRGTIMQEGKKPITAYETPSRILMSGLGADELFGGYTRHATAFKRTGYQGLIDELDIDFQRIGERNLGRDDRIISHWGREARYPYLDEDLVHWALRLPVWEKCAFGEQEATVPLPAGPAAGTPGISEIEPAKKLLRILIWKLGMKQVAFEKKRAIQFGTRSAKMETGKVKGTRILTPEAP